MITFAEQRKKANLSQQQVAIEMGVDRTAVSKWEVGEAFPRADKLPKLAKLFGCTVDDLLRKDE